MSRYRNTLAALTALPLAAHVGGCALDNSNPAAPACYSNPEECIDSSGAHHTFVVSSVELPAHAAAANELAFDLDGDRRPDNQLGIILPTLSEILPRSVSDIVDDVLRRGELIILVDVQATDMVEATGVGGRIYAGKNPTPSACIDDVDTTCGRHLSGNASFDIDPELYMDAAFAGDVRGGEFTSMPSKMTFELYIEGLLPRPLLVDLIGARASSRHGDGTMQGIAGGAILLTDIHERIFPMAVEIAERDCTGTAPACCTENSLGASLVNYFDDNGDCALSVDELATNEVLRIVLTPDLDMLDDNGNFAPHSDGINESVSLGAGFNAVSAVFTQP